MAGNKGSSAKTPSWATPLCPLLPGVGALPVAGDPQPLPAQQLPAESQAQHTCAEHRPVWGCHVFVPLPVKSWSCLPGRSHCPLGGSDAVGDHPAHAAATARNTGGSEGGAGLTAPQLRLTLLWNHRRGMERTCLRPQPGSRATSHPRCPGRARRPELPPRNALCLFPLVAFGVFASFAGTVSTSRPYDQPHFWVPHVTGRGGGAAGDAPSSPNTPEPGLSLAPCREPCQQPGRLAALITGTYPSPGDTENV